MKKIIFIDNEIDNESSVSQFRTFQRHLNSEGLSDETVKSIERIHSFAHLTDDELEKLTRKMFSGEYIISTYSMYTENHYGSYYQLRDFLIKSAEEDIKEIIYIDGSGYVLEALEQMKGEPDFYKIMVAVERNYIISFDNDTDDYKNGRDFRRVMTKFYPTGKVKSLYDDMFELKRIDFINLIENFDKYFKNTLHIRD